MTNSKQLADHIRQVHFGGNWIWVNLKDTLSDVSCEQANAKMQSFNTIAALAYHINYYVQAILNVLKGNKLDASDKFSFDHPLLDSKRSWNKFLLKSWTDAEQLANLVEQIPDNNLFEDFSDNKYGNLYRNILGLIEHTHYHLGQIVLIKRMIAESQSDDS